MAERRSFGHHPWLRHVLSSLRMTRSVELGLPNILCNPPTASPQAKLPPLRYTLRARTRRDVSHGAMATLRDQDDTMWVLLSILSKKAFYPGGFVTLRLRGKKLPTFG